MSTIQTLQNRSDWDLVSDCLVLLTLINRLGASGQMTVFSAANCNSAGQTEISQLHLTGVPVSFLIPVQYSTVQCSTVQICLSLEQTISPTDYSLQRKLNWLNWVIKYRSIAQSKNSQTVHTTLSNAWSNVSESWRIYILIDCRDDSWLW